VARAEDVADEEAAPENDSEAFNFRLSSVEGAGLEQ
jgi:hypothetical protein